MIERPYGELLGAAHSLLGAELEPLSEGYGGETFLVRIGLEELVLRLYAREPERAEIDAALLDLLHGLLPVPDVLELRLPRPEMPVALLLTSRLPGRRLDVVLAELGPQDPARTELGRAVGAVLARLSGVPFVAPGRLVVDTDSRLGAPQLSVRPLHADAGDLVAWVEANLDLEPFASWPASMRDGLVAGANEGADLLDRVERTCLVHGDFSPANLLVDPHEHTVTGLVDWAHAHAGPPVTDLGRLFRLEPAGPFRSAVIDALRALAPPLPVDLTGAARAADVFALVELAVQQVTTPAVSGARAVLAGYARASSLALG